MDTHRTVAILVALCLAVIGLVAEAKAPDKDTALLDHIIAQEIDSRQASIKHWTQMLTRMDMPLDGAVRVQMFMQLLTQETAYLGELKAHGARRAKLAYCTMILQQRLSVMSYEVKFKKQFGSKSEALPKAQAPRLSDKEVEARQEQLGETVALKKKLDSITPN